MQHIYQKLDSLKMGRKSSKPKVDKQQLLSLKTERAKPTQFSWNSNNKENIMKTSNLLDKRSNLSTKFEHIREETLDLHCLPVEVGERLLDAYMNEAFA